MANSPDRDIIVMVTGAARGLGRAMALALARGGARVAALDLPVSDGEMAKLMVEAKDHGVADHISHVHADVTNSDSCAAAFAATLKRFGAVHGVVNNAGIGMQEVGPVQIGPKKKFYEVNPDLWRRIVDTNVNGPFVMAKTLAPHLVAQGWGRIVNIVTSYTTMQNLGMSPYGPTKAAVEAATVIWSKDLADTGVSVNALLPGRAADTRMIPAHEITDRSKLVQPEIMGPPIMWLMSRKSDGVTGQRFIAQNWDPTLDPKEAALKAGARAGW